MTYLLDNCDSTYKKRSCIDTVFFFTLLLLTLIMGLALLYFGIRNIYMAKNSLNWPVAQGNIIFTNISEYHKRRSPVIFYNPEIRYTYTVGNISYTGNRISYNDLIFKRFTDAEEVIYTYQVNKNVKVYYFPDDPNQAVLKQGMDKIQWHLPGIGILFIITSIIGIITNISRRQKIKYKFF